MATSGEVCVEGRPTVARAVGTTSRSTGTRQAEGGSGPWWGHPGRLWAVEDHPTTTSDADRLRVCLRWSASLPDLWSGADLVPPKILSIS